MVSLNIFLTVLLAIVTLVIAVPLQDGVVFYLINDCDFDVYVREAIGEHPGYSDVVKCANFGESQEVVLAKNGGTGYGSYEVFKDSCGHSYKVARQKGGPVYQWEFTYAHDNGRIWYDLSHESGNPFTDVEREMSPHNNCPTLKCDAGNDGSQCDYAIQVDCTPNPIAGFLCGRGKNLSYEEVMKQAVRFKDLPLA